MFAFPVEGRLARDPISRKPLPAEGREIPESTYWIRRLRAGDITLTPPDVAPLVASVVLAD